MKKRILEIAVAALAIGGSLTAALAGIGTVNVTTSETSVLPANDRRRWVVLQNNSAADIWLKVDSSTNTLTTNNGIKLIPGASLTISDNGQANAAVNAISARTASGTSAITFQEGNEY